MAVRDIIFAGLSTLRYVVTRGFLIASGGVTPPLPPTPATWSDGYTAAATWSDSYATALTWSDGLTDSTRTWSDSYATAETWSDGYTSKGTFSNGG